jgi:hypothetical protein
MTQPTRLGSGRIHEQLQERPKDWKPDDESEQGPSEMDVFDGPGQRFHS